jgi:hypothetical protein
LVSQSRSALGVLALWLGLLALWLGLGSTLGWTVGIGVEVGRSVESWAPSVDPLSTQALNSDAASRTATKLRLYAFKAESPCHLMSGR